MKANAGKSFLYTFVFEFRGGTYLSQLKAYNLVDAKRRWAMQLQASGVNGLENFAEQELVQEVEKQDITPITGLTDTWCFSVLFDDQFGMIHVINTALKGK